MTKTYENEEHEIMNMNLIKKAIARLQHSMKYTNASNSNDDQSRHKKQTTSSRDSQDLNLNDDVRSVAMIVAGHNNCFECVFKRCSTN